MLKIDNYSLTLSGTEGQALPVLENISLHVKKGTCLGLAGESGSGKSVMAMSVVGLIPKASIKGFEGHIYVDGTETTNASEKDLNRIRGKEVGFIFQEPMTAMNPLMKLSEQISEVVYAHNDKVTKSEADKLVIRALLRAGFKDPEKFLDSYPHQLSGGMRQRAMIAMALVMDPKLIIADEPTTAIDAELQIQLLKELRQQIDEQGLSMLFISHDLGVLRSISDNIAVLYAGNLMEVGPADEILKNPKHPYTADLISALPRLVKERKLPKPIEGTLPSLDNKPQGCVYADRCSRANDKCRDKRPELTQVGENHCAACWSI
ncbi:MAG: ABC transporter ATP-binding protein [Candidatus Riflebacteria bacterium]|nr:ABC transporter ATP-binding protein [Candidatus Riflebacteria bacterium]